MRDIKDITQELKKAKAEKRLDDFRKNIKTLKLGKLNLKKGAYSPTPVFVRLPDKETDAAVTAICEQLKMNRQQFGLSLIIDFIERSK